MIAARPSLPAAIERTGVLAIVRGDHAPEQVVDVAKTLRDAGVSALEVTSNHRHALDVVAALSELEDLSVGAGTILSTAMAEELLAAGASFLVCPHVDAELVGWASAAGVPILPGAFTPTEALRAWTAGAAAVKLFPAAPPGPDHLRAIAAPLDGISFVPTGGIDASNARAFVEAGATAVAVASWLVPGSASLVDLASLRERARALARVVAEGRAARMDLNVLQEGRPGEV